MLTDSSIPTPSVQGYVLQERVGSGSYSVVFKAISTGVSANGIREVVAVKCIFKQRICSTQEAQDNLVQEIRILKRLRHPHIVQMRDFQWDKNYIYLITEYCNGGDLSAFVRRQRCLPEPVARKFLQQLAGAMKYLRSRNISHMDLKPQNILISYSGGGGYPANSSISTGGGGMRRQRPTLKLADFGFAMYLGSWDDASSMRGSPLYMAPEMFLHKTYEANVDLWSIGVIMHECLFGRAPFASSTMKELVEQIKSGHPIVLPDRPPISDDCRHLLTGLLERDPLRRLSFDQFFSHPFVDLEYAPSEECLAKATSLIREAIREDEAKHTGEAVRLYGRALAYFLPAIHYEEDPSAKEALRAKVRQYLRRAETLKASLVPKRRGRHHHGNNGSRLVEETDGPGSSRSGPTSAELVCETDAILNSSYNNHSAELYNQLQNVEDDTKALRQAWIDVPEVTAALTVASAAEDILCGADDYRYEQALEKYTLAIETALRLLSSEPKGPRRDLLRRFADRWLDRAHELKTYVELGKLNLSKLGETEAVLLTVEENTEKLAQDRMCVLQ